MNSPKPAMIRPRPKSIAELKQLQRDLFELAKPFVRAKCDILAVSLPSMIRYPDGRIETIYGHETTDQLARIDELWQAEQNQYLARNKG